MNDRYKKYTCNGYIVKGKKGFQEKPNVVRDLERELKKLKHNSSLREIIKEFEFELEKIKEREDD